MSSTSRLMRYLFPIVILGISPLRIIRLNAVGVNADCGSYRRISLIASLIVRILAVILFTCPYLVYDLADFVFLLFRKFFPELF